jgi:gluconokinase
VVTPHPAAVVVMGVAGSGKSSVGQLLAARLGMTFRDADEFHSAANKQKMASGVPLTDEDRWPWLDAIGAAIAGSVASGGGIVVACSALRRAYRRRIVDRAGPQVVFVWLDGSRRTLAERIGSRRGHFMPASMLDSQLATLEPPGADEPVVRVSVEAPLDQVVAAAVSGLAAFAGPAIGMEARPRAV